MKKLSLIFLMIFVSSNALALDWHTANQKTVAWDPVMTMDNGKPIPEGNIVKYQTYVVDAIADHDKQNPIDAGIVDINEKIFTLSNEGKYYIGVQALRYVDDELVGQSIIVWSDNPVVCKNEQTFGLKFYFMPDNIGNMYPKTE